MRASLELIRKHAPKTWEDQTDNEWMSQWLHKDLQKIYWIEVVLNLYDHMVVLEETTKVCRFRHLNETLATHSVLFAKIYLHFRS